jgi:hypothetical protein
VPAWTPADGPVRARTWTRGGPTVEVYARGEWRRAAVMQRQDRAASGLVTVHVRITLAAAGPAYRAYAWDPRSIRPATAATVDPTVRTWS